MDAKSSRIICSNTTTTYFAESSANSPKKGKMMRNFLVLFLALWATTIKAESPDTIRDNYPLVIQAPCSDSESDQTGHCFIFDRGDGTIYMVFTQRGEPVFVRQTLKDGSYITVWRFGEVEA